jgi:hypothetical protein
MTKKKEDYKEENCSQWKCWIISGCATVCVLVLTRTQAPPLSRLVTHSAMSAKRNIIIKAYQHPVSSAAVFLVACMSCSLAFLLC